MSERMTSPDEAELLKHLINACVPEWERYGFDRGQIGAAMAGIGLGMAQVHIGPECTMAILDRCRDCLVADQSPVQ